MAIFWSSVSCIVHCTKASCALPLPHQDDLDRPYKLWRYVVGSGAAPVCLYTEDDEAFYVSIHRCVWAHGLVTAPLLSFPAWFSAYIYSKQEKKRMEERVLSQVHVCCADRTRRRTCLCTLGRPSLPRHGTFPPRPPWVWLAVEQSSRASGLAQ
jgi:hypothetical protein